MADPAISELRKEVLHLFSIMETFRRELSQIGHPQAKVERFDRMTDQLDAIIAGTEGATETILHSVETIADTLDKQRPALQEAGDAKWLDDIDSQMQEIFQACAFQDLTGQRITKVVESLKFIDQKLHSLVRLWGPQGFDTEPMPEADGKTDPGERLEGPALEGEGASQQDIDKLFD